MLYRDIVVQDIINKVSMRYDKNVKLADIFKHYDTKITSESPLHFAYEWDVETSESIHLWRSASRNDEFGDEATKMYDLHDLVDSVCRALNNNKDSDCYRSFSKLLCVPLFKYKSGTLVHRKDIVNTVTLHLTVNYYDLLNECFDSYDMLVLVPFRYLLDEKYLLEHIKDYFYGFDDGLREYGGIEYTDIAGFTIDVSKTKRNWLNNAFRDMGSNVGIKTEASYAKDAEVVCYDNGWYVDYEEIDFTSHISIIRIYYLLVVYCGNVLAEKYLTTVSVSIPDIDNSRITNIIGTYLNANRAIELKSLSRLTCYKFPEKISAYDDFYHMCNDLLSLYMFDPNDYTTFIDFWKKLDK